MGPSQSQDTSLALVFSPISQLSSTPITSSSLVDACGVSNVTSESTQQKSGQMPLQCSDFHLRNANSADVREESMDLETLTSAPLPRNANINIKKGNKRSHFESEGNSQAVLSDAESELSTPLSASSRATDRGNPPRHEMAKSRRTEEKTNVYSNQDTPSYAVHIHALVNNRASLPHPMKMFAQVGRVMPAADILEMKKLGNGKILVDCKSASAANNLATNPMLASINYKAVIPNYRISRSGLAKEQKEVRAQHQERAVDFLSRELKVYSLKDAEERVFFISAKETLQARMQEQRGQPAHNGALAEGFQNRYFEFQDFERKFEECISKSAVKTKFEQHSQRGKHIATEIRQVLDEILERTQKMRSEQLNVKKEVHDKLEFTEQQLLLLTQEMKDKIHHMVEDVEQKVSKALNEEIRRLSVLIDEYSVPFHPDPLVLNVYKRELHTHVESGLGSNLRARLSTAVALNIENSQREMTERMSSLLPENKQQISLNFLPRREQFEMLYRLNCDNLCADFHEDLEFRFSWGFTAIINRFAGKQSQRLTIANYPQEIPPCITSPADSIDSLKFVSNTPNFSTRSEDWCLATRIAVASVTSQGTMGGLIVAGFMLKTVGWRLIAITGAVYGALYLYERLTWTNKAKEHEFKRQYVAHATKKLRLIVDLTSANCSHQVQQELSSTFARLCHLVDETTSEMDTELKTIANTLAVLEKAAAKAKHLRNEANFLINELDTFDAAYLKPLN
ncbi:PREDICTED: transmembrane GTPase Marf-like [Wasmannia auropunctata]|uniref:transmembrane GTPase Marf-like n=1 Tax=Wasmannia auropunctata TaxID=64793 RepID=UPI0005EE1346|nr:PREDICTED: transmembrane GTPase Marf-like [Wasmannia auropunctata]